VKQYLFYFASFKVSNYKPPETAKISSNLIHVNDDELVS